jgi:hypothetical protein
LKLKLIGGKKSNEEVLKGLRLIFIGLAEKLDLWGGEIAILKF